MKELDDLTNRLRERLHVQTSSRVPFQSPATTDTSHDQQATTNDISRMSPHLVASSQPFASDSLDDVRTVSSQHESYNPGAFMNNTTDQFVEASNRESGIVGGSANEGMSVYESALQNARQMLSNINQHMCAGPEAGTLTVSATYELTSGKDVTIVDANVAQTPAMVTRHAHFEDQEADDTFGPLWNRDDYDEADDDVNDDDVTVVEARPLNDVSSANFCNGLPDAVLVRGQTTFTEFSGSSSMTQLSSSMTQLSVDYGMGDEDDDEFDHSGHPYVVPSDDLGYFGNRSGAYSRLNYNANSNIESAETAPRIAIGNNSSNHTDSEGEDQREVTVNGMSHTAASGMLKRQDAEDGSCSSSEEEEDREQRRGRDHMTSNGNDRVNDNTENESHTVKVNGINSVDTSEHSRKSSSNSQDSIHAATSSIHSSEHSRRSSVSRRGSLTHETPPPDVVKRNAADDNVFSDDEIERDDGNGSGGNTPSDSLSPDRTLKKPPASPKQGKHDATYPFFQVLAVTSVGYSCLMSGDLLTR